MKKLIPLTLLLLAGGLAEAGSVQFSTYYPAPFGMYDRLRLVPRTAPTPPCDPGTLYINSGAGNQLEVCNTAGDAWAPLSGGPWTQDVNGVYVTDTNANVGIGTTAPASRLEVKGSTIDNTASALNATDSAGTSLLYVRNDGNVGIGRTDPGSYSIYVEKTGDARLRLSADSDNNDNNDNPSIFMTQDGGGNAFLIGMTGNAGTDPFESLYTDTTQNAMFIGDPGGGGVTGNLQFGTNDAVRMTIDGSTGNVGIGTNTPGSPAAIGRFLTIEGLTGGYLPAGLGLRDPSGGIWEIGSSVSGPDPSSFTGFLSFLINSNERMKLDTDSLRTTAQVMTGNSSDIKLTTSSNVGGTQVIIREQYPSGLGIGPGLVLAASTRTWQIFAANSGSAAGAGKLAFYTPVGPGYAMVIDTLGNVGIGTTDPGTNKLEVVGGPIKATGGLIIPTCTIATCPASAAEGQIWLCTDCP